MSAGFAAWFSGVAGVHRAAALCVKRLFAAMKRAAAKLVAGVLLRTRPAMATDAGVSSARRRMVVGLGNPGMDGSRHSVGMTTLHALARRLGASERWTSDRQVSGEVLLSEHQGAQFVLLLPRLLMNINGVSVSKAATKYQIEPEHIFLVHDELDKPLGKLAIKQGGSARGHNGVRSCVDCLQTDVMPRLRIGIGRPAGKVSVERYVLGRFSPDEQKVLAPVLEQGVDILLAALTESQTHSQPAGGRRVSRSKKGNVSPISQQRTDPAESPHGSPEPHSDGVTEHPTV
uniref:peptidyl-tRNA hydrolase n=2 Tax=Denticeps clupeoides TaxID=299321 RepID=A0AAY4ADY4_9TELE